VALVRSWRLRSAFWVAALGTSAWTAAAAGVPLPAQGVTTAEIRGTVRVAGGADAQGAQVRVVNRSTGYAVKAELRDGRFLALGLEVGGPYSVLVRRIGSVPQERGGLFLSLGQRLELDFILESVGAMLDTMRIVAAEQPRAGTGTTISDSLLRRLPTLNRDVYDFVRLVPQVSTRFGISGGGVSFRLNSFLIDGVSERQLQGNNVSGTGFGKAVPIDAVKEYQVLLAPYDARYGDFTGALINAVTRSGTNDMHGTAFVYTRNERLARATSFLRDAPYDRTQFGLATGGPIVRDRAHFFIATDFQRMHQPARGPYLGQSAASATPVPVSAANVERFATLLRGYGLDPGSGGRVIGSNPNANVFGRIDVSMPEWRTRVVLRHNYAHFDNTTFARPVATSSFPLSSNAVTLDVTRRTTALQLFAQLPRSAFNELLAAYTTQPFGSTSAARLPLVQVLMVPSASGSGNATLVAGPPDNAQGTRVVERTLEIADHLALRPGTAHTLAIGARAELFTYHRTAVEGRFGRWMFRNLDSLAGGRAASFRVAEDFGSATARLRGAQMTAYVNEEWQATSRLALSLGLRADVLAFDSRPSYNPAVDSLFGRRTSDFPTSPLHWSPRVGFTWDVGAERHARVRGGAGIFAGRPPLGWFLMPIRYQGAGIRTLNCPGAAMVPSFDPDPNHPPTACADGRGFVDGPVNLVDGRLRMAETFRASLAYDRMLPWRVAASVEALYTRPRSDFLFVNVNLAGPQGVDRHGRVLYGTIDSLGTLTPGRAQPAFVAPRERFVGSQGPEVIDLRNHSRGYSYALTGRLEKRFSDRVEMSASYTHSRARDVQSRTSEAAAVAFNNWAGSRPLSGRHDEIRTGISSFDLPHRVVVAGTWAAPWRRWATALSLYYIGESGTPFTYVDSAGIGQLGDLNADGTNANDPIYVPRNAADTSEIAFDGSSADEVLRQQLAFERFIASTACLRRQRGRIVARNSCRGSWVHTTNASVRQSLPAMWGHGASLQLDVFNLLNLLDKDWGLYRVPNAVLLQHVGQTAGPTSVSQPVFRFDLMRARYNTENVESAYQVQLALRYSF
jgi:carboxypeptidase family protein